jgi:hypothetical protein
MKTEIVTSSFLKKITWLILFSIAMGYLESAVVVYLREIYYPNGFVFPLTPIDSTLALTEFWREVATLVMLLGIGILTGKSSAQRLAFFLLSFAIWDIFYYVFLYVLLGWPSSLMTWDILFLVPVPWVGPVLTPLIISTLMLLLASFLIYFNKKLNRLEWSFSILGSIVVIISWVLDYWNFITKKVANKVWTLSSKQNLFDTTEQYIPTAFNWPIFIAGVCLISLTIFSFYFRNAKSTNS